MLRRSTLFRVVASAAIIAGIAPHLAQADPQSISEGVYWGTNFPGVVQGSPIPLAVDSNGNLKVTGGGGGVVTVTGQYNPSPFPTAASTTPLPLLVNNAGALYIQAFPGASPFPISGTVSFATAQPVTCVSGCANVVGATTIGYYNPSPIPATSATALPQAEDNLGQVILSPLSRVQAAPGQYNPSPVPLQNGQQAPENLDIYGNQQVDIVATPSPGPLTVTDAGTSIVTANTAQAVFFANPIRKSYTICDPVTQLFPLWISDAGQGTSTNLATEDNHSAEIFPGQCYTPDGTEVSKGEVDVISTGTITFFAQERQ